MVWNARCRQVSRCFPIMFFSLYCHGYSICPAIAREMKESATPLFTVECQVKASTLRLLSSLSLSTPQPSLSFSPQHSLSAPRSITAALHNRRQVKGSWSSQLLPASLSISKPLLTALNWHHPPGVATPHSLFDQVHRYTLIPGTTLRSCYTVIVHRCAG